MDKTHADMKAALDDVSLFVEEQKTAYEASQNPHKHGGHPHIKYDVSRSSNFALSENVIRET